jgi:AcrR family transcriptional regulator
VRREQKKRQTRLAMVDAALDLFLEKGYEATTIDEIVAAVPVSQRTFFRYFAAKEDVVTWFMGEYDQVMADALAERPAEEPPLTALFEAQRAVLAAIAAGDPADTGRFRRIRRLVETTPALMAAQIARYTAVQDTLVELIAERQGVDPEDDIRPRMIVAFHIAAVKVAFEDCARHDVWDPILIARRVETTMAMARRDLPSWI